MSETVSVDEKGRLVLPKKIREEAGIAPNSRVLVRISGAGKIELSDPNRLKEEAQRVGRKKLSGWREDEHEATTYLLGNMKKHEAH
jgi:AbrB family looped-hinge helix DNA binding protein